MMAWMANSAPSARSRKRRSSRFKMKIPITVRAQGGSSLNGETTSVSKHGASIRIASAGPRPAYGERIEVVVRAHQAQPARVVWVDATSACIFAVELEGGGEIWGIHFPGNKDEEWRPAAKAAPEIKASTPEVRAAEPPLPIVPVAIPAPAATHPPAVRTPQPAARRQSGGEPTLLATITGISAVRIPLLESAMVEFTAANEATVLLTSVVEPGAKLRLLLDNNRVLVGRVVAIGTKREAGKWRVRIRYDAQ